MVDWGAISALGVAALTAAGGLYQARKGERNSDRDDRYKVLKGTVDTLERQLEQCHARETADEGRYRQQDEYLGALQIRHQHSLEQLDDAHSTVRDQRIELREQGEQIQLLRRRLRELGDRQ